MPNRLLIAAFLLVFVAAAGADDRSPGVDLADKLLHLPAPAPPGGPQTRSSVPDENASVDSLVDYWVGGPFGEDPAMKPPLSDSIRQKLLQGALKDPIYLPKLVDDIPQTAEAANDVKRLYDKLAARPETTEEWKNAIHNWLMLNSRYYRDDLFAAARSVKVGENHQILNGDALERLAQLDWAAAYPLLIGYERTKSPELDAFVKVIRFEHAISVKDAAARDDIGARLDQIARDPKQATEIRHRAIEALFAAKWQGRDSLLRALLPGAHTWTVPGRGMFSEKESEGAPIPTEAIAADADHFVPLLAKLLTDTDPKMQWSAAGLLLMFPQPDNLRKILPLMTQVNDVPELEANALLARLADVDLPESRPLLRRILVAGHADPGLLAWAMVRQKSPELVEALRIAIDKPADFMGRHDEVFRLYVEHGGISTREIASAIEAFAIKCPVEEEGKADAGGDLFGGGGGGGLFGPSSEFSPLERRGSDLVAGTAESSGVAALLLDRADALRDKQPRVAAKIWEIVAPWSDREIDQRLVARLLAEPLDLRLAQLALARSVSMGKNQGQALKKLVHAGGFRGGLAAALLGDVETTTAALGGADVDAIRMLLACARMMRTPLPIAGIQRLFARKNVALSAAAERFLIVDDSPEARRIVLARHPGEAMILGSDWGQFFDDDQMDRSDEKALREKIRRPDGPAEIFALQHYGMGQWEDRTIISIAHDEATLDVEPTHGKHLLRTLSDDERRAFADFIKANDIDNLNEIDTRVVDGSDYVFVHVTRAGGRRIFMHNPGEMGTANTIHHHLVKQFERLENRGRFRTHYPLQDVLRDATVAWAANPAQHIRAAWKRGDDFRVLIEPAEANTWGSIDHFNASWHALHEGKIAGPVTAPAGAFVRTQNTDDDALGINPYDVAKTQWWRGIVGDAVIRSGDPSKPETAGVWRCRAGQEPQRIAAERYVDPVTTRDGEWAIVERDGLFRLNLSTGKILPCTLPAGRAYTGICNVPRQEMVLVRGSKGSAEKPDDQYFLVDAETGKSQSVEGDFQPLIDNDGRRLHATNDPDEFWLAYPFGGETDVILYNVRTFHVTRRLFVPGIEVHGDAIAVDNAEGAVYVAVNGDLLRIPLTNAAPK